MAVRSIKVYNSATSTWEEVAINQPAQLSLSNSSPQSLGSASSGTSIDASRADHVHSSTIANPTFTGVASFPDGSASAPSITNTGDTNTGILFPAANVVAIATNGVERIRLGVGVPLMVGATASQAVSTSNTAPYHQFHSSVSNTSAAGIANANWVNGSQGSSVTLAKSRGGAVGTRGIVASGDVVGNIIFAADDEVSTTFQAAAAIGCAVDGTPGTTDMPGRLVFSTTPDGSATLTERMRIDSNGLITGTGTSLGAWTAYTPTLSGTGWAIGDGTAKGYYCQIGKLVAWRVVVTFGSTSTYGSADPTISLPTTARNAQQASNVAVASFADTSTSATYVAAPLYSSTTTVGIACVGTNGQRLATSSTLPFTWASTDVIRVGGTYEAA